MSKKRILIFGVTGMLGHVLFKEMSKNPGFEVFATTRRKSGLKTFFTDSEYERIRDNVDADNFDTIIRAMASVQPDIVINCIGIIKQLPIAKDPLTSITVNAQLPHRLSMISRTAKARLIHISTDCVFNGTKGQYKETDPSDAVDLYGRTKYLGEVDYPHCVTLRTSIIGHELKTEFSLVDWFLSQDTKVKGFSKAYYSGFPTLEIENIITNYIIPNEEVSGVYNISSSQITKYELLKIIKKVYGKTTNIEEYDGFEIDRTLNSDEFRNITSYSPPSWEKLVESMYQHAMAEGCYQNKKFRKY